MTWDQALVRRLHTRDHRRPVGRLSAFLLVVGLVLGFLPGAAQAHHFEEPVNQGAQINVTPDGSDGAVSGTSPGLLATQSVAVEGKAFPTNARLELRECTPTKCQTIGAAAADATGAFSTQVVVSAYPAVVDTGNPTAPAAGCASQGPNQCRIVAVQLFSTYVNEPSSAEHNICFAAVSGGSDCSTSKIPPTTTTTTAPPPWKPAAPMSVARQGLATAVGADGRIYALGGTQATDLYGIGDALKSAEVFDPCGTGTWSPIAPMPRARTEFAAATGPDGRIYAIGGRDSNYDGTPLASVDAYDPATNTWSTVAPLSLPRARLGAATGPDGHIYAIAGKGGNPANSLKYADGYAVPAVEAYDTATHTWAPVTPLPLDDATLSNLPLLGPTNFGAATGPDGRVYSISAGPFGSSDNGVQGTPVPGPVESYAPESGGMPGIWRKEVAPNTHTQGFSLPEAAAVTTGPDGRIYDIGGLQAPRSVLAFDTAADTWTSSQEVLATRRMRPGAAAGKDGRLYAIGGLNGDSDGLGNSEVLSSTEALQVGPNLCPRLTQPADFDGNGTTDYSVFRPANGTWFVKDGASAGYGADGDVPIPADYDGDHKTDLAIFRPATGLWAIHRSSDNTDTFVTYGISTDVPIPADYDGDGRADIAVYRPEFATWWVHRSSDNLDVPTTFGIATDVPVPADYDGDGRADLAVFRDGTWFTLPSSGGAYIATNYGRPGDIPVPADYDADHSIDRAVFRPATGEWFLHHSSDGTDENFAFGVGGDVPVPGDYDGDRTSDPALFRPGTGQWFVETGETVSWGISTDIPLPLPYAIRRSLAG